MKNIDCDILSIGSWTLKEQCVNLPLLTTNQSESMNAALKNFLNHKEMPADMFVLNLYDFAHMYEQRICRGRIGAGEYTLRIHLRGTFNVQNIPSYPSSNEVKIRVKESVELAELQQAAKYKVKHV